MPRHDGTGPRGTGPMSGQGGGQCVVPLNTPEQELEFLKNQERVLRQQLENVESRMKHLEGLSAEHGQPGEAD